jgi:hypothetical protein
VVENLVEKWLKTFRGCRKTRAGSIFFAGCCFKELTKSPFPEGAKNFFKSFHPLFNHFSTTFSTSG